MTRNELKRRFKGATETFLKLNAEPVVAEAHPTHTKPAQGSALVSLPSGDGKGSGCHRGDAAHRGRATIRFIIRSRRPADWDGYHIKELQDLLVHACVLPSDAWDLLKGGVTSEKVHTPEEEGTLIEITYP